MVTLVLARWSTRFWAWLIDVILVGVAGSAVSGLAGTAWQFAPFAPWLETISLSSLLLFAYWTVLEGWRGQSIGKMVMNIRTTGRAGEDIGYGAAAVESFGKAFLLVLDCLIGWIAMPGSKLRLFNRLSNTIVIETEYAPPEGIEYVKQDE
ncbi:RDD family protein [Methanoculleus sp. FWC-SCC1]|uniref:RDD family protein n=1 Tax=Methanoculleus frigidifontis TaxID=2584085 RepID=A0ABT8ME19_9EURY|nr:RDD family protein [Methanoculleus sp. FWC-SCC1]MDN7026185.1 RDD family protein [Methanoculleus sp. FWC-SCC1]